MSFMFQIECNTRTERENIANSLRANNIQITRRGDFKINIVGKPKLETYQIVKSRVNQLEDSSLRWFRNEHARSYLSEGEFLQNCS